MPLSENRDIPLFPLSVFLLPGERMELHVFEPRYRQLFAELENEGSVFGIPYTVGRLNNGLGSSCRLVKVIKRYTDGESDVLVECEGLFKMEEFQSIKEDRLYPYGNVRSLSALSREQVSKEVLFAYEELAAALEGTALHFHLSETDYSLAILSTLNCSSEEKHAFVQLKDASERDRALLGKIQLLLSLVQQEKVTENGIYMS